MRNCAPRSLTHAGSAALMLAWFCTASAQPLPGPATIQPGPLNRPGIPMRPEPIVPPNLSAEEAEVFRKSMAAYQQCTRDKPDRIRLTEAADNLIHLRDRRQFWESRLADNARRKYPNPNLPAFLTYEQMLAGGFAEYKSLGGTAATIDAVRPVASPCTNPWATFSGPGVPLTDSRTMTIAPK